MISTCYHKRKGNRRKSEHVDKKIIFIFFLLSMTPPLLNLLLCIHFCFYWFYGKAVSILFGLELVYLFNTLTMHWVAILCTELTDCYSVQNAVTDNIYLVHIDNGIVHSDLLIIAAEYVFYPAILWSICHWFHINVILYANFNTKNRVFSNMHIKEK